MKNNLLISYFLLFCIFMFFSFVFTDPNLILLKADWFVSAQTFFWQKLLPMRNFRTIGYAILIISLFINYLLILKNWSKLQINSRKKFWQYIILLSLPLIFSYNALSHDVFNYIFNAKMVVEFGANPHIKTALDFPDEPMLRFMNNVHTPAPYGYGWTVLSLLPYILGLGKFLPTLIIFKLFALVSLLLTLLIVEKLLTRRDYRQLAMLFLNPLLLIEVLSSAHNDLWMLAPALLAIYLSMNLKNAKILKILAIIGLMILSVSIKYATLVLLPFLIYLIYKEQLKKIWDVPIIFDLMALVLFLPLLTERSKQFLPWYLIWSLVFLPMMKNNFAKRLLVVFSISSLLRYLPWVYYVPWMSFDLDTGGVENWQKLITWAIPSLYLLITGLFFLFNRRHCEK